MADLPLTIACGPYDRMEAIHRGDVRPEGINATYVPIQSPPEIFARMVKGGAFDVALERHPVVEPVFASDDQLRIQQRELRRQNRGVGRVRQSRQMGSQPRYGLQAAGAVRTAKIFGLVLEMFEIRTRGKVAAGGHTTPLSMRLLTT